MLGQCSDVYSYIRVPIMLIRWRLWQGVDSSTLCTYAQRCLRRQLLLEYFIPSPFEHNCQQSISNLYWRIPCNTWECVMAAVLFTITSSSQDSWLWDTSHCTISYATQIIPRVCGNICKDEAKFLPHESRKLLPRALGCYSPHEAWRLIIHGSCFCRPMECYTSISEVNNHLHWWSWVTHQHALVGSFSTLVLGSFNKPCWYTSHRPVWLPSGNMHGRFYGWESQDFAWLRQDWGRDGFSTCWTCYSVLLSGVDTRTMGATARERSKKEWLNGIRSASCWTFNDVWRWYGRPAQTWKWRPQSSRSPSHEKVYWGCYKQVAWNSSRLSTTTARHTITRIFL